MKVQMLPTPVNTDGYERIKDREQLLKVLSKTFLSEFRIKHPSI